MIRTVISLALVFLFAGGARAADPKVARAAAHYKHGRAFFDHRRYDKAIAKILGDACLAGSLGASPDCKVYDDFGGGVRDEIPACLSSERPCYRMISDTVFCPATPTHMRVIVDRSSPPPEGTHVVAECLPQ